MPQKVDWTDLGQSCGLWQMQGGPRFSLDALALAHGAPAAKKVLDLGTATGVVATLYARDHQQAQVIGVDIDAEMIHYAQKARDRNGFHAERLDFITADVKALPKTLRNFDLVLANPPYFKTGTGPAAKNKRLERARSESAATLKDFMQAGKLALHDLGHMLLILPPHRLQDALYQGALLKLQATSLQPIYSFPDDAAAVLLLLLLQKSGKGALQLAAPFYFYDAPGKYSNQVQQWYQP